MVTNISFKDRYTFDQRRAESTRMLSKHPEHIPVIVEKALGSTAPDIDKKKHLILNDEDSTVARFSRNIEDRLDLPVEQEICLSAGGVRLETTERISAVNQKYKDKDNFLYLTYSIKAVVAEQFQQNLSRMS